MTMPSIRNIMGIWSDVWLLFIQDLPGPIGFRMRYGYWRRRLSKLGPGSRIDCGVHLQNPQLISIGENCWIDRGVIILAGHDRSSRQRHVLKRKALAEKGAVTIGNNVHIGPYSIISGIDSGVFIGDDCGFSAGVRVYAFTHHYRFDDRPGDRSCSFGPMVGHERQSMISGPVTLERNVGVALGAAILPGVWIGPDSFVSAHALVLGRSFPENSIIAGNPAKRIADRFKQVALRKENNETLQTD